MTVCLVAFLPSAVRAQGGVTSRWTGVKFIQLTKTFSGITWGLDTAGLRASNWLTPSLDSLVNKVLLIRIRDSANAWFTVGPRKLTASLIAPAGTNGWVLTTTGGVSTWAASTGITAGELSDSLDANPRGGGSADHDTVVFTHTGYFRPQVNADTANNSVFGSFGYYGSQGVHVSAGTVDKPCFWRSVSIMHAFDSTGATGSGKRNDTLVYGIGFTDSIPAGATIYFWYWPSSYFGRQAVQVQWSWYPQGAANTNTASGPVPIPLLYGSTAPVMPWNRGLRAGGTHMVTCTATFAEKKIGVTYP